MNSFLMVVILSYGGDSNVVITGELDNLKSCQSAIKQIAEKENKFWPRLRKGLCIPQYIK